jgi:integrase
MDVAINQDTRQKKQNGTFPILLRLSDGESERTLPIPTGYEAPKEFWDSKKREIKKGYKGYHSILRVNNSIQDKRNTARKLIDTLGEDGTIATLSIHDVKARIVSTFRKPLAIQIINKLREGGIIASDEKKDTLLSHLDELVDNGTLTNIPMRDYKKYFSNYKKSGSVFDFLDELEQDLRTRKKRGYADVHKDLNKALEKFVGHKNLSFNQVNLKFLKDMEAWHMQKDDVEGVNGLGTYLRTLRSTYNKAVKVGIADKYANPFDDYQIKKQDTDKRAISDTYLTSIINLKLSPDDHLFDARNYFLASFAMWGMSFIDLAYLKIGSWVGGRVKYRRSKTSRLYNVQETEMLKSILEYYAKSKKNDDFIFPIIKRKDYADQYLDMETARTRHNRELKELAKRCDIDENLTSYVTRHSFATRAKLLNIPVTAIQQMLGHSSIKTTEIYLDSLPDKTIDDYADNVLDFSPKTNKKKQKSKK